MSAVALPPNHIILLTDKLRLWRIVMFPALASYYEVCVGGRDDARKILTDIPITHAPVNWAIPIYIAVRVSYPKHLHKTANAERTAMMITGMTLQPPSLLILQA